MSQENARQEPKGEANLCFMKKPFILFIIFISIIVGVVANHRSEAQATKPVVVDSTVIERLDRLMTELDASRQTNIINQVTDLVSGLNMLHTTHEANTTLTLLEQLRSGHTNEAIAILEKQLDVNLIEFSRNPNEIHEAEINVLKQAKEYRIEYPHKAVLPYTDAMLDHAFDLIDKK